MTVNCAHRGDPTHAPESTLASFERAVTLGAPMVELDVNLTVDGHLVVMHDPTVDRCTNGSGTIAEMTFEQIRALDAGSWFAPEFAGQKVPTFEEAAAALPAPMWLNLHLKTKDTSGSLGFEQRFMDAFAAAGLKGRAHIVHDYLESLDRVRTIDPEVPCCWLPMCSDGFEYIRRSKAAGFNILQPDRSVMSAEFCAAVHEAGMTANVFYANTEEDMRLYIGYGIDGILTDNPCLLQQVLASGTG
jgi:glycerophosphoryl diester phosphodiesterase